MALALVPKRYKQHGLTGLGEGLPTQVRGVIQRIAYEVPETCDKCGSKDIHADPLDARRYACFQCASDWFIVETPWRRLWTPAR